MASKKGGGGTSPPGAQESPQGTCGDQEAIRELRKKAKEGTLTNAEDRELGKLTENIVDVLLESTRRIGNAAKGK